MRKVKSDFGNTIINMLQFRDWLENRRDKDDEIFKWMWKAVETEARKIQMEKKEEKKRKKIKTMKIWNNKEEKTKLEEETRKLVPKQFHKWIKVFRKKASERIPTRKI